MTRRRHTSVHHGFLSGQLVSDLDREDPFCPLCPPESWSPLCRVSQRGDIMKQAVLILDSPPAALCGRRAHISCRLIRRSEQHGCHKSAKQAAARKTGRSAGSVWHFGESSCAINNPIIVRTQRGCVHPACFDWSLKRRVTLVRLI